MKRNAFSSAVLKSVGAPSSYYVPIPKHPKLPKRAAQVKVFLSKDSSNDPTGAFMAVCHCLGEAKERLDDNHLDVSFLSQLFDSESSSFSSHDDSRVGLGDLLGNFSTWTTIDVWRAILYIYGVHEDRSDRRGGKQRWTVSAVCFRTCSRFTHHMHKEHTVVFQNFQAQIETLCSESVFSVDPPRMPLDAVESLSEPGPKTVSINVFIHDDINVCSNTKLGRHGRWTTTRSTDKAYTSKCLKKFVPTHHWMPELASRPTVGEHVMDPNAGNLRLFASNCKLTPGCFWCGLSSTRIFFRWGCPSMLNGVGKVHCVFTHHGSFRKCHGKPQSSSWHILYDRQSWWFLFICSIIPSCTVPRKPKAGSKLPKKGKVLSEPVILRSFGTIRPGLRFAQSPYILPIKARTSWPCEAASARPSKPTQVF